MNQNTLPHITSRAFTLIELIMVMLILVIVVSVVAPSLRGFGIGRRTNDAATQIVALAQYARTQAISQGRTYRLNFDPSARTYWLTMNVAGSFQSPTDNFGQRFQAPEGVQFQINVTPQANTQLNVPTTITQIQTQGSTLVETPTAQPNQVMQNLHDQGNPYVEFVPSGRSDPAQIKLTDSLGHTLVVACLSATEMFHVLSKEELQ